MMEATFNLINPAVRANCLKHISGLPEFLSFEVEIRKPKKTRQQEKYWHNLLRILAAHNGSSFENIKDELKLQWLPVREVFANGRTYILPAHSSTLSKEAYSLLIDKTLMAFDILNISAPSAAYYGLQKVNEVA